jgi:PadR family transcriptional regulator, regulatory protein PadR
MPPLSKRLIELGPHPCLKSCVRQGGAISNHQNPRSAILSERKGASGAASGATPYFAVYLWTLQSKRSIFLGISKGRSAEAQKSKVFQETLDLMILKVLDALGPQHGYGIACRIEQAPQQVLQLNEGTVYISPAASSAEMDRFRVGASENNRKAKYYSLTKSGRKQLARETAEWERIAGAPGGC